MSGSNEISLVHELQLSCKLNPITHIETIWEPRLQRTNVPKSLTERVPSPLSNEMSVINEPDEQKIEK